MPRIAILVRRLDNPGGAEQSMLSLKQYLEKEHSLEVEIFGISEKSSSPDVTNLPFIFNKNNLLPEEVKQLGRYTEAWGRYAAEIESFAPDLIISQHELAIIGARLQQKHQIPHTLFLRDYSMSPSSLVSHRHPIGRTSERALWPIIKQVVRFIFSNTSVTIANSKFLASVYQYYWGIRPFVVYPFINVKKYQVSSHGNSILHVNPSINKGIDITLEIARELPHTNFIVVGPSPNSSVQVQINSQPNISYLGYQQDMKEVYRKTRVVLVPSLWNEPFGRVPIEAGISGIPSITSNRGGLTEANSSNELVTDDLSPQSFLQALSKVYSQYDQYQRIAQKHAKNMNIDSQGSKFVDIIDRKTSVTI